MDWMKERQYTERPRMHHNRRKKKRVNCNVRAVEVVRGAKGFGFTISGQQPCILSCIVQGSPAETAGLRSGDYLVSVNGQNVSKVPHDNVVQLIGKTKGVLRLQIVENYYSDSTDEEGAATVRTKPKYTHKPCTGARRSTETKNENAYARLHYRWNMSSPLPPPLPPVSHKRDSEKIVHRTVVGYLGTIDIPNQLHPSSMMQVLRKCIKRLKAEKRNPATVLLTIHVANIKLTNSGNRVIAEYPSYRIIFCNSFSEQDKQYFGILTKSVKDRDDIVSNSCHVFTIYYKLIDHTVHSSACNVFGFTCTKTSELNGVCQEFPDSCNGLIGAIQTLYISDSSNADANPYNETRRHQDAASPQPSNVSTSTAHSSNSDSGIGFKDDYGCRSDKNTVPDFSRRRQCLSTLEYRDRGVHPSRVHGNEDADGRLTVRAVSNVGWNDVTRSESCKSSAEFSYETVNFDDFCNGLSSTRKGMRESAEAVSEAEKVAQGRGGPTTCPLPSASTVKQQGLPSSSVDSLAFACTTALLHGMDDPVESSDDSIARSKGSIDARAALPPKPYVGVPKSRMHSFEDLNSNMDYTRMFCHSYADRSENPRPWGSLQEIRNIGSCAADTCLRFEGSLIFLDHARADKGLDSLPDLLTLLTARYCQRCPSTRLGFSGFLGIPQHGSTELCDKSSDCKGIHTWTSGFEKLLEDPKGLQTFAEFLKKEFSHENIYFWAACERYKDTKDIVSRRKLASQIYQRHLSSTAAEPVNVDSHAAGQITQELLSEAPADLFLQAQKQVFNLMKFDSYPRFLRSDLYRRCIEAGNAIVGAEDCDLNLTSSPGVKLKKSHSDAEDRCRKSILPWNRKNRSKSKDRGESEYNKAPSRSETIYKSFTTIKREVEGNNNDDSISISSSRSSLASWDLAFRQSFHKHSLSSYEGQSGEKKEVRAKCTGLCRVILPDGSTTVVPTSQTESIKDVVTRLLDKRALRYSNYDVLILATDEMVDSKYPSSALAGQEVEVVPTKVLKVDLPSRRVITVIAHKGRSLKEVLRPLLNKYGFSVDLVNVWDDDHCISMDIPAINAPSRLTLTVTDEELQRQLHPAKYTHDISHAQSTLDEFTNKAFEEFLVGKSTNKYQYSEGSCKSDDQHSEGSSVLPSKFFLRDSTMHGKKKGKSKCCATGEKSANDYTSEEAPRSQAPLIAKWRNGVKLQVPGRFDGEDLYEGLKRAQRSRLEDQRGTEINFEMPDFLKNEENGKPAGRSKIRRPRVMSANCEGNAKFYGSIQERQAGSGSSAHPRVTNVTVEERLGIGGNDRSSGVDSLDRESKSRENSFDLDATLLDAEQTLVENGSLARAAGLDMASAAKISKPPPLPPKPKHLAASLIKTNYTLSSKSLQKSSHLPFSPAELSQKTDIF